jgi:hypothetical protein
MFDLFLGISSSLLEIPESEMDESSTACVPNLDWGKRIIFVPDIKTTEGRRMIPMSDPLYKLLRIHAAGKPAGWLFPSTRSKCHLTDFPGN